MPYPNFHAARVHDPDDFARIVVLKTLDNGIMIYGGPLKSDPDGPAKTQAYRFPKDKFTPAEAKQWLKDNDVEYIDFEPATEEEAALRNFIFAELQSADADQIGKPFDGMAAGEFIDMWGTEFEFKAEDLPLYAKNTMASIASTTTESGETVGLPIDQDAHDRVGGAGWIVKVGLADGGEKIIFYPKWTEVGRDLISRNLARFFSPTIDKRNKVIMGGSLTNWPATRTEAGEILLRPVELSSHLKKLVSTKEGETKMDKVVTKTPDRDEQHEPEVKEPNAEIAELLKTPEGVAELGQQAERRAQEIIEAAHRKAEVVEFAASLAGGTREKPWGLPVRAEDIVTLLLSLPSKQSRVVQAMLTKIHSAAIDFAERGLTGDGLPRKPELPVGMKRYMEMWVASGKDVAEFFKANPELGSVGDWNVAEFAKPKE